MSAPWIAALRDREVVAPDSHSITRFEPYVTITPAERLAFVELAEAAKFLPFPLYSGNLAMVPDVVLKRVHDALDRAAGSQPGLERDSEDPAERDRLGSEGCHG